MAVDYSKQYRRDQLEPFFPNEIIKMSVAVLCTLAVIMLLAILPVLLDSIGVHALHHQEEPANPRGSTPVGIKPEWYFLAVYQYLRLMPTQLLGISGKTLGVLSQGIGVSIILLLPFWYRKRAAERPKWTYRAAVTLAIFVFITLTLWGGWKEDATGEEVPLREYLREGASTFILFGVALLVFFLLIWQERRAIRRVLDEPPEGEEGHR